jgi:hypothetical protein
MLWIPDGVTVSTDPESLAWMFASEFAASSPDLSRELTGPTE